MATPDLDLVKSVDGAHLVELQHGSVAYDSAEDAGEAEPEAS